MRIVQVDRRWCVLDTGEQLLIRYEKLRHLCEQLQQEGAEVTVHTWVTREGTAMVNELIEVHRVSSQPPAEPEKSDVVL